MIEQIVRYIIPAALAVLPKEMDSPAARAMLVAIGLQESRFQHRRQVNFGPARGFWQFEKGGVRGVIQHKASRQPLLDAMRALRYGHLVNSESRTADVHYAIEDNDVLACVLARLLLWTLPGKLPTGPEDHAIGWAQYLDGWRPGKPHPATWPALYGEAWSRVLNEQERKQ